MCFFFFLLFPFVLLNFNVTTIFLLRNTGNILLLGIINEDESYIGSHGSISTFIVNP